MATTLDGDTLLAAAEVFRRQGFSSTSIEELAAAMSVSPADLYAAFQDKAGLLEAALSAYVREVIERRLAPLRAPNAGIAALRRFLHEGLTGPGPLDTAGCLLPKIAHEQGANAPLPLRVAWSEMREAFADALAHSGSRAPEEQALGVLALLQGLLLLRAAGEPLPTLLAAVDQHLSAIESGG
jgi:AcrR family transcriptional regulator